MAQEKTYRSKKYMGFVKTLECCLADQGCEGYGEIIPHVICYGNFRRIC